MGAFAFSTSTSGGGSTTVSSEQTWTPTFSTDTGVTVTIGAPTSTNNNFWYTITQEGANRLVNFCFSYEFITLGAGADPSYIDLTLPFTIANSYSNSVALYGVTYDGATGTIGAFVTAPGGDRNKIRVFRSGTNFGATFPAGNAFVFIKCTGTLRIDP